MLAFLPLTRFPRRSTGWASSSESAEEMAEPEAESDSDEEEYAVMTLDLLALVMEAFNFLFEAGTALDLSIDLCAFLLAK